MAGGNTVGSDVTEERGRDVVPTQTKKKRDQSKARESPSLENVMAELGERLERVEHNVETLEGHVLEQLDTFKGNVQGCMDANTMLEERFARLEARMADVVQALQASIDEMREDLTLCKKAAASGGASIFVSTPKVDYPRPVGFNGARDAKEVENYLWRIEQYFEGLSLTDKASKVRTATLYLIDTTMLWWRRKHVDIERGTCHIDTWDDFKNELKQHFYPDNVVYEARKKLRELKQQGTIHEYVKEFTTLMLQIPNLSEEDLLFYFMDELQSWAKQELHRRDVKSVDEAIAVAESLAEFQPHTHTYASKKKDKYPAKGGGEKQDGKEWDNREQRRPLFKGGDRNPSRQEYEEKKKAFVPKGGCFVCKGPHAMSNCPKLGSLSALMERNETETRTEEEPNKIGSLQVLNALKAKPMPTTSSKGLMYVEAYINGNPTKALVDTGATHNFVTREEVGRLGLQWTRGEGWLKTVNTKAQPLNGIARGVELHLGTWKGQVNFSVAPMDDFKVVLGMDFLRQVTAIPMPSFNTVCILEKGTSCMVPTVESPNGHLQETKQLSAMQITKGVKQGEPTYLAMLKEKDQPDDTEDTPTIIREVLEKNKDVMPAELPNKLPPRREVDHKIELEPGAKPPAMAPYRMAPPELEELRRQLKDLLDTGKIRPSKAPYSAPVLF